MESTHEMTLAVFRGHDNHRERVGFNDLKQAFKVYAHGKTPGSTDPQGDLGASRGLRGDTGGAGFLKRWRVTYCIRSAGGTRRWNTGHIIHVNFHI